MKTRRSRSSVWGELKMTRIGSDVNDIGATVEIVRRSTATIVMVMMVVLKLFFGGQAASVTGMQTSYSDVYMVQICLPYASVIE